MAPFFLFLSKESVFAIIVFVGISIVVQGIAGCKPRHLPTFVIGLMPPVAEWGMVAVGKAFDAYRFIRVQTAVGIAAPTCHVISTLQGKVQVMQFSLDNSNSTSNSNSTAALVSTVRDCIDPFAYENHPPLVGGLHYNALVLTGRGALVYSITITTICIHIIDWNFAAAAVWALITSLFSRVGLQHSDELGLLFQPKANKPRGQEVAWKTAVGFALVSVMSLCLLLVRKCTKLTEGQEPAWVLDDDDAEV